MTTVPGHNLVIQQSGAVQELIHPTNSPKPSPEQAVAVQEANELVRSTTVQEFDEAEKLKQKKEKQALRKKQQLSAARKKRDREMLEQDPDAPGRLLDTTI